MNNEETYKMLAEAKRIQERGCPDDDNHFMRVEWAPNESHIKVWCADCGRGETVWPTGTVPLGEPAPAPKSRITLLWLHERFNASCRGLEEPDCILMGNLVYQNYLELLAGRVNEHIARGQFKGVPVIGDSFIGDWDVVFGFRNTVEEDSCQKK